jgi:hypothetical protein
MSARRTSRLLVSTLTTAALTATGLATLTAAPAAAAPAAGTYDCTFPLFDELEVPLTLEIPELPAQLPAGIPVPAGDWDVEGVLVLPDLVLTLLAGVLGISSRTDELELMLGTEAVPVDLTSPLDSLPLGDIDLPMSGGNQEFVPMRTGTWDLSLPESFDLVVLDVLGITLLDVSCELWSEETGGLGSVEVVKQRSSLNARVIKKPVQLGKRPKVLVSVLNQTNRGASGDVVATLSGTTVGRGTLKQGTAKLRLTRLPVGRHKVKLTYLGDKTVAKSVKTVTVRVVRKRS